MADSGRSRLQVENQDEERLNEVVEGAGAGDAKETVEEEATVTSDVKAQEKEYPERNFGRLSCNRRGKRRYRVVDDQRYFVCRKSGNYDDGNVPLAQDERAITNPFLPENPADLVHPTSEQSPQEEGEDAGQQNMDHPERNFGRISGNRRGRRKYPAAEYPVAPGNPGFFDLRDFGHYGVAGQDVGNVPVRQDEQAIATPFLPDEPADLVPPTSEQSPEEESEDTGPQNKVYIGRIALKSLRVVSHSSEDEERVLSIIHKMSVDDDPCVRTDLMNYVPYMAMYCHSENLLYIIQDHLIPWVMNCLVDQDYKVRKAASVSLLVLIERALVPSTVVEEIICPAVVNLPCEIESEEDYITGIVKLICRMPRFIGDRTSEKLVLEKFCSLSRHPLCCVRRVCVSNFVDFAMAVSRATVENFLVPLAVELVEDLDCVIRKACGVVLLSLACMVPMDTRRNILTPTFMKLLSDEERVVEQEAFCSLGPFICTFAVPSVVDLLYNEDGILNLVTSDGCEFRLNRCDMELGCNFLGSSSFHPRQLIRLGSSLIDDIIYSGNYGDSDDDDEDDHRNVRALSPVGQIRSGAQSQRSVDSVLPETSEDSKLRKLEGGGDLDESREGYFNSFQYWREPIVDLNLDPTIQMEPNNGTKDHHDSLDENWGCRSAGLRACRRSLNLKGNSSSLQIIVPQVLIDAFTSMTDSDTGDDYSHLCAYNIPAVALTLGRSNWAYLRKTYKLLSENSSPGVRRSVAASIHEIANIVGQTVAANELLPIFQRMMNDEDKVKIAALHVVSDFLEALPDAERMAMLPKLFELTYIDNDCDWRVREEWAQQLVKLVAIYDSENVAVHLKPLVLELVQDRVAQVRNSAIAAVKSLLRKFKSDAHLTKQLRSELINVFARGSWERRQIFAHLCALVFDDVSLDMDFAQEFLPILYKLSWDQVANVRIAVARALVALSKQLNKYVPSDIVPIRRDEVATVLLSLQEDVDPDVRECASNVDEADQ